MMQNQKLLQNDTQKYTLLGVVFGLTFPIIATMVRILTTKMPLSLSSIFAVQANDPLLWIIDTAPFIIGYISMLAGRRQDSSTQREVELTAKGIELHQAQNLLEERVAERTKELEDQSKRLRIAAEIAKEVTSSKNLPELLDRAGQLIQEKFGFYYTGLFIIDTKKEFAVLAASPTEAGKQMIADGLKLRVGYTGIIGRVASNGDARVVMDVSMDPTYEYNSLLPNTRSEMALPLSVENQIIGVLDIQSDQTQAFSDDDVAAFQLLADQLATAIERTRLLQQVEQNLRDLEQAYGQSTQKAWKSLAESDLLNNFGYQFDNIRIQPLVDAPPLGQKAITDGTTISESDSSKQENVAIPIKLRGQSIGAVTVKLKEGHKQTTVNTIEQAVERLASALENARLFEEARQRAEREQMISQVTSAISAAPEFDSILRTVVEEVGKSLGDSEVSIRLIGETDEQQTGQKRG